MSMEDGSGFENRIAELIGEKAGPSGELYLVPQGAGFIRKTLRAGACDVVIGYAQGDEMVQNTNHYYTSAYGVVTRKDGPLAGGRYTVRSGAGGSADRRRRPERPPRPTLPARDWPRTSSGWDLFVDRRVENPVGDMLAQVKSGELGAARDLGAAGRSLGQAGPRSAIHPAAEGGRGAAHVLSHHHGCASR